MHCTYIYGFCQDGFAKRKDGDDPDKSDLVGDCIGESLALVPGKSLPIGDYSRPAGRQGNGGTA